MHNCYKEYIQRIYNNNKKLLKINTVLRDSSIYSIFTKLNNLHSGSILFIKKSRPTKAATRLWGGRFYGAFAL